MLEEINHSRLGKLHYLKRRVNSENMSLRNHLMSILHDAEVVSQMRDFLSNMVFFANLRNGKWYSDVYDGHCYFKSTDGHESSWSFSLSRMNLELARVAAQRAGAVIVDSTRMGKAFPDSMTATIPIWCSVMNEIVFLRPFPLNAPPWMSPSVSSYINDLLPSMVLSVSSTLKEMIRKLLGHILLRPFRPIWVVPDEDGVMEWKGDNVEEFLDHVSSSSPCDDYSSSSSGGGPNPTSHSNIHALMDFTPLVLLSCSPARSENMHSAHHSWKYIQGAGDDEENWSCGLTPELFWKNKDLILKSDNPNEVDSCVSDLLRSGTHQSTSRCQLLLQEKGQEEGEGTTSSIDSVGFSLGEMSIIKFNSNEANEEGSNRDRDIGSGKGSSRDSDIGSGKGSSRDSDIGSGKGSNSMGNFLVNKVGCDQTAYSNFNSLHCSDEGPKITRIPALFSIGSSRINIGLQPLLHERSSGSQSFRNEVLDDDGRVNEEKINWEDVTRISMTGRKEQELKGYHDTIQSFIAAHNSLETSLRAVIIFPCSSPSASIMKSDAGKELMEGTGVPSVSTFGVVEHFIFKKSLNSSSCPSTSTDLLSASSLTTPPLNLSDCPLFNSPNTTSPSFASTDIYEFSDSASAPVSVPITVPIPTYDSIPGLILRAGLSKKDSSGGGRSLWCESLIPACLAFYRTHCLIDENHSQMHLCPTSSMCNGSILIICEDGILSCTVAMAILLSHYRTTFEFDTLLPIPQSLCPAAVRSAADTNGVIQNGKPKSSQSPLRLLPPSEPLRPSPLPKAMRLSKGDIRACLSVLQMYLPMADQIPRRLIKELNMFFSSYRASR